jgi:opacity protein-like surface antigen
MTKPITLMNFIRPVSPFVLAGVVLASAAFQAAGHEEHGFYLGADAGVASAESTSLREYPDAPPGNKVKFYNGARLSLGAGYRFTDWFSLGAETGFIANEIKNADAALVQAPILGVVEFRLPNRSPVEPFAGAGAGVSLSVLGINDDTLADGGTNVDGADSDAVFAWQAYGGLRFRLTDHLSLGAVYKYFSAEAPEWKVENTSQSVRFGRARVHSVSVVFNANF